MAPEKKKSSKRKSADATAIEPKQAKKAKLEKSKSKKTSREEKLPVADEVSPNTQKPKSRPSRKTAADLFDNPADAVQQLSAKNTEAAPSTKGKKDKKKAVDSKKDDQTQQELSNPVVEASTVSSKITKMQGTTQAISSNDFEVFESEVDSEDDSEDDIPDASNLLAGFDTDSEDELPGLPLDQIPVPDIDGKALSKAREVQNDPPGILYIGRIPRGFYEHQMREYFSQFGTVTRLRLARNRRTGASKHFAFIEFDSTAVAEVVQKTMDKYLMFGHILQVRLMPTEAVHENIFAGAGKRFKIIPWNKMEVRRLHQPRERNVWQENVEKEDHRRSKLSKDMEEMDYEFEAPKLKTIAKTKTTEAIENVESKDGPQDSSPAVKGDAESAEPQGVKAKGVAKGTAPKRVSKRSKSESVTEQGKKSKKPSKKAKVEV